MVTGLAPNSRGAVDAGVVAMVKGLLPPPMVPNSAVDMMEPVRRGGAAVLLVPPSDSAVGGAAAVELPMSGCLVLAAWTPSLTG